MTWSGPLTQTLCRSALSLGGAAVRLQGGGMGGASHCLRSHVRTGRPSQFSQVCPRKGPVLCPRKLQALNPEGWLSEYCVGAKGCALLAAPSCSPGDSFRRMSRPSFGMRRAAGPAGASPGPAEQVLSRSRLNVQSSRQVVLLCFPWNFTCKFET